MTADEQREAYEAFETARRQLIEAIEKDLADNGVREFNNETTRPEPRRDDPNVLA